MPMPERLRVWCEADAYNLRIIRALMDGAVAGFRGEPLGAVAERLGITARSAEGDALETGWDHGRETREREEP